MNRYSTFKVCIWDRGAHTEWAGGTANPDVDEQERLLKWSVVQCVNDRSERMEKIISGYKKKVPT